LPAQQQKSWWLTLIRRFYALGWLGFRFSTRLLLLSRAGLAGCGKNGNGFGDQDCHGRLAAFLWDAGGNWSLKAKGKRTSAFDFGWRSGPALFCHLRRLRFVGHHRCFAIGIGARACLLLKLGDAPASKGDWSAMGRCAGLASAEHGACDWRHRRGALLTRGVRRARAIRMNRGGCSEGKKNVDRQFLQSGCIGGGAIVFCLMIALASLRSPLVGQDARRRSQGSDGRTRKARRSRFLSPLPGGS